MPRTALEVRQFPGGLFSTEDQSLSTGSRFYVHSGTGTDAAGYGTDPDRPVATLDYAIGLCTASVSDIIYVMPGHAETTTAIAADKIGIRIIGIGVGRNRPALTATTAATDLVNVTAASTHIENIRFVGAASGVTALLDIAAADCTVLNCVFEHGAAPLAAVTVQGSSHRFAFIDCQWYGTAAGPDYGIYIEAGAGLTTDNWRVIRPYAAYGGSAGLDLAFVRLDVPGTGYAILDAVILGFDTLAIDINSSVLAIGDGIVTGHAAASAAVTWANAVDAGGAIFSDFKISDDPATRGKSWPAATPT